ncbi:MAG: STAS domain-containing protein [Catenulispora sp.]|nr:STAS domain-containing protein [Catenulispora sp.]
MDEFTVSATPSDSSVLVAVAGDVDLATADRLHTAVAPLIHPAVQIDMRCADISFLDSAGLRVLLELNRRAQEAGATLTLREPSEIVSRTLDLAGVAELFTVMP